MISLFVLLVSLSSVSAQTIIRRRRRSVGGIIAGIIVAILLFLLFAFLVLRLQRRRRARAVAPTYTSGQPSPARYPKPFYGGPFGGGFGPQPSAAAGGPGAGYNPGGPSGGAAPYGPTGPQHQLPNAPAPPPPYVKDENTGQPSQPNQNYDQSQQYPPPPGAPPPAQTTGQDQFVGGFRH